MREEVVQMKWSKMKCCKMKWCRIGAAALGIVLAVQLAAPALAEEAVYTADQAEVIGNRFVSQADMLEEVLGDDSAISYWRFVNGIEEDEKIRWAVEQSSHLVDEYPDKKDYVEILANLMAMQTGRLAQQIENQSQFDHFKGAEDYAFQLTDIVTGIVGGVGCKAYAAISPIVDAALGGGKLAVESVELTKYYEASIQNYNQSREFLEAVSRFSEDELLASTASDLLKANEELLLRQLEYLSSSAGAVADYEASYFSSHLYANLLKETTLYQTDETVKWFTDSVEGLRSSLSAIFSLGKAAFSMTIMGADLNHGTSSTFNRYQEMRIVAEAAEAVSKANQEISIPDSANPADVLDDIRAKTNYYRILMALHARGEYLIYQLLMEDAGMHSDMYQKLDLLQGQSTENWYQRQKDALIRYESILDHMFDVPEDDDSQWLQAYAPVLDQYYAALMEMGSPQQYEAAGMSPKTADGGPATVGYFLTDVDYDGIKELMIGNVENQGLMYDFYTLHGNVPVQLACSSSEKEYYYCVGHEVKLEDRSGSEGTVYGYYVLQDGAMENIEFLHYDESLGLWACEYASGERIDWIGRETMEEISRHYVTEKIDYLPFTAWRDQRTALFPEETTPDSGIPAPFTAAQLAQIAAALGIPDWLETEARQDDPYYWDAGERWLTAVSFFADGEMVAGASVDSFTLEQCRNIWRYSGPKSPELSAAADVVNPAVSVDFQRLYENGMERGMITGLDSKGNPVWVYETEAYAQTELDRINQIGIFDSRFYFVESGTVKTLYLEDGTLCWENEKFGGSVSAYAFGDGKQLYLSGYYGPDFFAVDFMGNLLVRIEEFESGSFWPSAMEYDEDGVTVYMDQTASEEIVGYRVSLTDLYAYEPVYKTE